MAFAAPDDDVITERTFISSPPHVRNADRAEDNKNKDGQKVDEDWRSYGVMHISMVPRRVLSCDSVFLLREGPSCNDALHDFISRHMRAVEMNNGQCTFGSEVEHILLLADKIALDCLVIGPKRVEV